MATKKHSPNFPTPALSSLPLQEGKRTKTGQGEIIRFAFLFGSVRRVMPLALVLGNLDVLRAVFLHGDRGFVNDGDDSESMPSGNRTRIVSK